MGDTVRISGRVEISGMRSSAYITVGDAPIMPWLIGTLHAMNGKTVTITVTKEPAPQELTPEEQKNLRYVVEDLKEASRLIDEINGTAPQEGENHGD